MTRTARSLALTSRFGAGLLLGLLLFEAFSTNGISGDEFIRSIAVAMMAAAMYAPFAWRRSQRHYPRL